MNKKTTGEQATFWSNTAFSLNFIIRDLSRFTLKISRRKISRFFAPLPVSARPKSLLQFNFKNHEDVRTDLKKRQRPNTSQILLNVKKKQDHRNIAPTQLTASPL